MMEVNRRAIVTNRGIEEIVDWGTSGAYFSQLLIPKEVFIEAYEKFIVEGPNKERDNI